MMPTKADFMAQITGLMGGRVAEEVVFDEISAGASNDIQKLQKLRRQWLEAGVCLVLDLFNMMMVQAMYS